MPRIAAIGTAVPPHLTPQDAVRDRAAEHFSAGRRDVFRLIQVFDNVGVRQRYFCKPLDWLAREHTFRERNGAYQRWAERLSMEAIERCLENAGLGCDQVDHLIFVSTSGMATPSIDARLANRLPLGPHTRRTPIFGLGCAGGAAGLTRAWELAKGSPSSRILLVAVEICSLTFQSGDFSKSNLVASALFADGAAAALVVGDETDLPGTAIVDAQSTIWPETLDVMGWDFSETGLQVIFAKSIPHLLQTHIKENLHRVLELNGLACSDLAHYAVHPGGTKILESFQESLGLTNGKLEVSREVLAGFGNMSSPTVLFILKRVLEGDLRSGDIGLAAAFGPGFSSELLLWRVG